MRYLVFSDSHGHWEKLDDWLCHYHDSVDGLICAGDFYRDGLSLSRQWQLPYFGAQGNNDHEGEAAPWQTLWHDGTCHLGVIHGHQWDSSRRLEKLTQWGQENECQMVIFGHSHVRYYQPGVIALLNPGALYRPRNGEPATAALLTISNTKPVTIDWILLQ
jgi:hypothetical protein